MATVQVWIGCCACGRKIARWNRKHLKAWKQHMDNGWKPIYLDLFTCPDCTELIEAGTVAPPPHTGGEDE